MKAVERIKAERQRQIEVEGWTADHDDAHETNILKWAAVCYMTHAENVRLGRAVKDGPPDEWPWDASWWKPTTPLRDLEKAGALLLAEIERAERKVQNSHPSLEGYWVKVRCESSALLEKLCFFYDGILWDEQQAKG